MNRLLNRLPQKLRLAIGGCIGVGSVLFVYCAPICFSAPPQSVNISAVESEYGGVDLRDRLSQASVQYGEKDCERWTGNRWDCEREPWLWVGLHQGRLSTPDGPEWRRCIWAHAHTGETLRIAFSDLQWSGALQGEVAIVDTPVGGGTAQFRVLVDRKQRAVVRVSNAHDRRDHDRRWKPWTVNAHPDEDRSHDVVFEVSASEGAWRQVCFTAHAGELGP